MQRHDEAGQDSKQAEKGDFITRKVLQENMKTIIGALPAIDISDLKPRDHRVRAGDRVSFKVKGFPLPELDYLVGELKKSISIEGMPILAEFDGADGKMRVACDFDPQKEEVSFLVPKGSVDSLVTFLLPVKESNAESCELDESAKKMARDMTEEYALITGMRQSYYRYAGFWLNVLCDACKTDSICPFGAIMFDSDDRCYVDKGICRGQSRTMDLTTYDYTPDGRQVRRVESEDTCFMCFSGDESLSSRCAHRRVSRVMDSSTCACGSCIETSQIVPGVCLREHCEYGATTGGNAASTRCGSQVGMDDLGGIYEVNHDKCVGCYTCYDNILCERVKMKAHIKSRKKAIMTIEDIRFKVSSREDYVSFRLWGRSPSEVIDVQFTYPRDETVIRPVMPTSLEFVDKIFISAATKKGRPLEFSPDSLMPRVQTKSIDLKKFLPFPFPMRSFAARLEFFESVQFDYTLSDIEYL